MRAQGRRPRWLRIVTMLVIGLGAGTASGGILFQEDFDDGNLTARGWYDIRDWGVELFIDPTERRNGSASLEVRYQQGSNGPWMRRQFPGQDRVYTRYYRKWASNWLWPATGSGPHDTYLFGMYGQPYFAPTQTYVTVYTESIYQGPPAWQRGTIGLGTRRILQGESYRYPASLAPPPPRFQLDRWHCIETLATMNSPGNADGRIQVWLDGTPIFDVTGVTLRNPDHPDLQFDLFFFGPWYHVGAPQVQSTWMDALVVATERIGCLAAAADPPAPPGSLRSP
jgi:hypothetical protein